MTFFRLYDLFFLEIGLIRSSFSLIQTIDCWEDSVGVVRSGRNLSPMIAPVEILFKGTKVYSQQSSSMLISGEMFVCEKKM